MGNRLQSICPYFAMFPDTFVTQHLLAYTDSDSVVLDPFCGRGTAVLESLRLGRDAIGGDINHVAVCISRAKANPPSVTDALLRLRQLEVMFHLSGKTWEAPSDFFEWCFHENTFQQVMFLRSSLDWQNTQVDCFLAAVALGCLHGESHKTPNCFSNRMPRTISTKPAYSVRWWSEREMLPPTRDVFAILRKMVRYRLEERPADKVGIVVMSDARSLSATLPELNGSVDLLITSPPYLDTTDFQEDQWLRLWFLGGNPSPTSRPGSDDRHTVESQYWNFLTEAWAGCAPMLKDSATLVVRIGGKRLSPEAALEGVQNSLLAGLKGRNFRTEGNGMTSLIKNRQTSAFRPGPIGAHEEHDFVFHISG